MASRATAVTALSTAKTQVFSSVERREQRRSLIPKGKRVGRCGGTATDLDGDNRNRGSSVIPTIAISIILTIAIAALVLAPRMFEPRVVFDTRPDPPAAFGFRMAWLAIRSNDMAEVAAVLGLDAVESANWRTGIGTVYDEQLGQGRIYLTPPVNGWTFVVGQALPQPLGRGFADKCTPLLLDLAGHFPDAQYFACYPALDYFAWARVLDGKLVRAFAIGDEGIIWNKGRASREERGLGLKMAEVKGVKSRKADVGPPMPIYPTEAQLMHLASCWSLDPTTLTGTKADLEPGIGYVCVAPAGWKPERLRRTG